MDWNIFLQVTLPLIGGIGWILYRMDSKFDKIDERFDKFEARVDERFNKMDERIDERFNKVDGRFNKMDERIDERFNKVESKLEGIGNRLNRLEAESDYLKQEMAGMRGMLQTIVAFLLGHKTGTEK